MKPQSKALECRRAAGYRPHPLGVYAANHTAQEKDNKKQEKDSKQRPKDRVFLLVGHQGDMPIDVESCHWLPEKPAKKQGS